MEIKIADTQDELDAVYRLTHDLYLKEGYSLQQPDGRLIHYPHLENIPETIVLIATVDGHIVGSNSLTLDGTHGLQVDCDIGYKDKVDEIRENCRKNKKNLGCSWRIVTSQNSNQDVILSLLNATAELMYLRKLHVALYNLNPKHEKFYRRFLGMVKLGEGICGATGLTHPPSVLMMSEYEILYKHWSKVTARRNLILNARPTL